MRNYLQGTYLCINTFTVNIFTKAGFKYNTSLSAIHFVKYTAIMKKVLQQQLHCGYLYTVEVKQNCFPKELECTYSSVDITLT